VNRFLRNLMMTSKSAIFGYWAFSVCAALLLAPHASAQTVSNLAVTAATSKRVDLSWSGAGGSFNVQRRVLGGTYSTLASVTNNTYSDSTIDPYTTYEYQVSTPTSSTAAVRVGPPPAGLTSVAPAPLRGATPVDTYGLDLQMVLDGNGDPAFLFGWGDQNGDSNWTDSVLLFRSWNRVKYDWNPVVTIATVGDRLTRFRQTTALGYDASTNTFAAAAENENGNLNVYVSTNGGAAWAVKKTFQGQPGGPSWSNPSMVLAGGSIHLAVVTDNGLHYVTGKLASDSSTWIDKIAQTPAGTSLARDSTTTSIALDSSGNPGIAYWVDDTIVAYNEVLLYWKAAGSAGPVRAMDSQGQQSDDLSVKLAFFNLNPRILAYTQRTDADFGVGVHFVRSDDGGLNWQKPIVIPPDGDSSTDFPFDLALNSKGEAAVAFGENSSSGGAVCGSPKLSRSTDLVNWKTCAIADLSITGNYSPIPGAVQLAFGGNDKLWMAWWEQGSTPADSGILLYREPPAGAITGPVITGIVDGASFRPNIVAGSWVTIQGANLSGTTRTWADADFKGNALPTDLSGVSVNLNGLPAAVYYISPTQLNVQAPANISGSVSVQVTYNGATSNTATASAVQNAPALFAYSAGGKTYPAAVFVNSQIVGDPAVAGTAVSKAHVGDAILLFGTGLVPSPAGNIVSAPIVTSSPATVTIGGTNASVAFAGLVASGEFQINITVPPLPPGEYPVVVTVNGQSSQSGVIIPVQ
jgi:uncharacterized protein (TIGR03437 family)